jgi:hypothetical protein
VIALIHRICVGRTYGILRTHTNRSVVANSIKTTKQTFSLSKTIKVEQLHKTDTPEISFLQLDDLCVLVAPREIFQSIEPSEGNINDNESGSLLCSAGRMIDSFEVYRCK